MNTNEILLGEEITCKRLAEIKERCTKKDIELVVVFIPTKELVYKQIVEENKLQNETYTKTIGFEEALRRHIAEFLKKNNIALVDTLPALSKAAGAKQIYAKHDDGHPIAGGYKVIAETIKKQLSM